jgi:hypothetical protein
MPGGGDWGLSAINLFAGHRIEASAGHHRVISPPLPGSAIFTLECANIALCLVALPLFCCPINRKTRDYRSGMLFAQFFLIRQVLVIFKGRTKCNIYKKFPHQV